MQPKLTHPAGRPTAASTGSPAVQPAVRPLLSTPASVILLVAVSMFAIAPLFYPGFIQTHSGFVSVWNVIDLRANLGHLTWTPHLATTFDPFRSDG
ncbi:MAG: hypothetical protein KDI02_25390, partial [Anaerolineae bacterium]|nr:hypothetical protein [Anaerolineae bacterium]